MKKNQSFHKVKTSKISDKTNIHDLDLNLISANKLLGLSAVFVAMLLEKMTEGVISLLLRLDIWMTT